MIKELYISKSFNCIGQSMWGCFDCKYCRLTDEWNKPVWYENLPSEISPLFKFIPIVINIFYGDPLLQIKNTIKYLIQLEKTGHKGPIIIITKGDFSKFPDIEFDLDLHFAFSTFGIQNNVKENECGLDGRSFNNFINNLHFAHNRKSFYQKGYGVSFQ